jgi:hypothetical protein
MRLTISSVFLVFSLLLHSQSPVNGVVTDENGVPLPGANVIIEDRSID